MATKIQLRRDTAANWSSLNPVLAQGEPGLELDTSNLKIGDGVKTWSQLDYVVNEGGAEPMFVAIGTYIYNPSWMIGCFGFLTLYYVVISQQFSKPSVYLHLRALLFLCII